MHGNGEEVQPLVDPSPWPRDAVEGDVVGEAEGADEAEALVLGAGGAVADDDGAADDVGAAAGEDLRRLHDAARGLGQADRPHRPRVCGQSRRLGENPQFDWDGIGLQRGGGWRVRCGREVGGLVSNRPARLRTLVVFCSSRLSFFVLIDIHEGTDIQVFNKSHTLILPARN